MLIVIFMNTENSKKNELRKFVFNLSQRLDLRSSDKRAAKYTSKLVYLLHVEIYKKAV